MRSLSATLLSLPLALATLFAALIGGTVTAATINVPGDHKTIQAAVDAAAFGDVVLVAAGTYKERITLKPGVTLRSAGDDAKGKLGLARAEATILDCDFAGAEGAGVSMAEDSILDGFTVTGVGKYDEEKWNKHYATQGNEQPHEEIGAPGTPGVAADGITRCTVVHNIVHHIGYTGIAVSGAEGKSGTPHIYRNIAYRNMGGGIGAMRKSTPVIEENICFENFYAGVGHEDASALVIRNICYGNIRAGVGISEHSKAIVRENKCYGNRRAGIGVRTYEDTEPLIENNECYNNDMSGIGADENSAPTIRNNRCYDNAMAGIGCQGEARPVIIGNTCYRNKLAGVASQGGAQPLIKGNECYENGKAGIAQTDDAQTTIIGNYCHHNGATGIGFDDCEHGVSLVVNNRVIDNAQVAIGIHSGWTVTLSGNELAREGGLPPIVMVFEGATATFNNNTIRGGGVAGIRVAGTVEATGNHFDGTSLRKVGPPNFAIWGLPNSTVTMTNNQVTSWRHALQATGASVNASGNTVSNFHRTAFDIKQPTTAPNVFGNTAISADAKVEVVTIDGPSGVVAENVVKAESE
ncbi:MAG: right-handed parallel beta-helix repeat-containing protein [Planctomycetaceae bacterium]|nr:right-handed parallel beta-helix repeat-containing protein [Planctomycetaceae bacterium]